MIGEFLSMIVEAIFDYLLPWRVICSLILALIGSFVVCRLLGDPSFRVDFLFAGIIVGLVAGIFWQSRHW
jgi:hypothetical protein